MVSYKAVELGASTWAVGVIGALFALAPLIFAIKVGQWIDRGRTGRALFIGTLTSLTATVFLVFSESLVLVSVCMPLLGIGHLLVMTGGQTMTGNRSADRDYERNFGLLTFYASVGHAVGPFVGGLLADQGGSTLAIDVALWFAAGLFACAALVVLPLIEWRNKERDNALSIEKTKLRDIFAIPTFKPAIFVSGAVTSVIDVMLVFLPLLGRELGMSATQVGVLLGVRAIASMLVRVMLGPISHRLGMRSTLNFGAAASAIAALAIAFTSDFVMLAVLMAVAGFATGIGQPLTMAWVSRITPIESRGLAISMRLTSNRLGQVIVPSIAGAVAATGVGGVFVLLAALQAVSYVISYRSDSLPDGVEKGTA